jgi:hypothetical protein
LPGGAVIAAIAGNASRTVRAGSSTGTAVVGIRRYRGADTVTGKLAGAT